MRLWAATHSIAFDEFVKKAPEEVIEVSFGFKPQYIGEPSDSFDWPLHFLPMGERALRQIPGLERTATAAVGHLERSSERPGKFVLRSAIDLELYTWNDKTWPKQMEEMLGERASVPCQMLGRLSFGGREFGTKGVPCFYKARILRFLSLCLRADDPRFGEWFEVRRYGDLGSDPDVIAAAVLVAEIELAI